MVSPRQGGVENCPPPTPDVVVNFVPEGGTLVPGIDNRCYFSGSDALQQPLDVMAESSIAMAGKWPKLRACVRAKAFSVHSRDREELHFGDRSTAQCRSAAGSAAGVGRRGHEPPHRSGHRRC